MNWSQISGIADRIILMGLMYLAGRGIITSEQAVSITSLLIGLGGAVWGWYNNRPQALISATISALPGTKIVTDADTAKAAPSSDVVSSDTNKVVAK